METPISPAEIRRAVLLKTSKFPRLSMLDSRVESAR